MAISEEQVQHRTTESGRLRFVLGKKSTDVALPAEVPLADLLPAVLPQFGAEWVEQGADHEGWVAQRVGEAPLDEDRTIAELGLLDGETIYLRPRADQLEPIDYDDLVDGVGEQVQNHAGRWRPARTRWLLRLLGLAVLLLGCPLLLTAGQVDAEAAIAGGVTALLLATAMLVSRGAANPVLATLIAGVAVGYSALTGVLLLVALDPVATVPMMVSCAAAGALIALVVGLLGVADSALLFTGAITFTVLVGIPALIASVSPASAQQAASIGLVVMIILSVFVPSLAFRLSGLTLPMLPTNPSELTEEIEPVPQQIVVERGAVTVGYSRALHVGLGSALTLVMLAALLGEADVWTVVFGAVVSLLLFLRSRHPDGAMQRWSLVVPAATGVATCVLLVVTWAGPLTAILATWLPSLAVGGLLLVFSEFLPGRRLRPYWGRTVDIFESLTAVAVLPLLLQLLHVYAKMRGLAG
ncbi:type VII secretion integral membrane protein EccD [Saccharopolyspora sp. NFXS83]|uniref:type VII secretion integral membrane protein EccD n=1 Tax=Saccharopolyspora sp. NFXS83 TaxID=2993560 RepID=UPI00224ABC0A|nr:type VII secretion integral membrane protein EccD [Saccharopolyspora sp. NFXS83]MCX2731495.1 type VII secretion integral membrane protein EccD [Saccharopolyspora sp. NFXS83]